MISREAVIRMIEKLAKENDPTCYAIEDVLKDLLIQQDNIEDEEQQRHERIMKEINPLGQD